MSHTREITTFSLTRLTFKIGAFFTLAMYISLASYAADNKQEPEILGQWATAGYGAVVNIYTCIDKEVETLCGDIVWVWDPENVDAETIPSRMLWGFEYRDSAWRGGRLKNPEDGKTYKGKITLRTGDLLDLKGCAGPFCKTQTWRRLQSLPHVNSGSIKSTKD